MIERRLAALVIRVGAIFLTIYSIRSGIQLMFGLGYEPSKQMVITGVVVVGLLLLAAVLLWKFPATVADKLLPADGEPRERYSLSEGLFERALISIIGLWFFASAILSLIYWGFIAWWYSELEYGSADLPVYERAELYSNAFQLLLGLCLMIGADRITWILRKVQYVGVAQPSNNTLERTDEK